MKQSRRTKKDMEHMNNNCRLYLLANGLDPYKAYDDMIKEHLMAAKMLPHYIKGLKDFVTVSEELKQELSRYKKQEDKEPEENPIDKLKLITEEQYKSDIMPMLKETEDKNLKMAIVDLYYSIQGNGFKHITNEDIRSYKRLGII